MAQGCTLRVPVEIFYLLPKNGALSINVLVISIFSSSWSSQLIQSLNEYLTMAPDIFYLLPKNGALSINVAVM